MWYYVTVFRDGERLYVVLPTYGKFGLSNSDHRKPYLWETEQDARDDKRWQSLLCNGDIVEYRRKHRG